MPKVTEIPAKKQVGSLAQKKEIRKLRVAAYCRVSTDYEEQASSYQTQIQHYEEAITKNPDWVLAGIFADDGISATSTKNREQFNNMIQACKDGKIDMIITKSISRFARNTVDCLNYIRELKALNIPVYFEKESINTMDAKGEVLITIMASLAQQESESLSQNVRLGIKYRFQQGIDERHVQGKVVFMDKNISYHIHKRSWYAEINKETYVAHMEKVHESQNKSKNDGIYNSREFLDSGILHTQFPLSDYVITYFTIFLQKMQQNTIKFADFHIIPALDFFPA